MTLGGIDGFESVAIVTSNTSLRKSTMSSPSHQEWITCPPTNQILRLIALKGAPTADLRSLLICQADLKSKPKTGNAHRGSKYSPPAANIVCHCHQLIPVNTISWTVQRTKPKSS